MLSDISGVPLRTLQQYEQKQKNIMIRNTLISDQKKLKNYYNMALSNQSIYNKLSYISKLVYNEPLNIYNKS